VGTHPHALAALAAARRSAGVLPILISTGSQRASRSDLGTAADAHRRHARRMCRRAIRSMPLLSSRRMTWQQPIYASSNPPFAEINYGQRRWPCNAGSVERVPCVTVMSFWSLLRRSCRRETRWQLTRDPRAARGRWLRGRSLRSSIGDSSRQCRRRPDGWGGSSRCNCAAGSVRAASVWTALINLPMMLKEPNGSEVGCVRVVS
jgi:hypothetical protein